MINYLTDAETNVAKPTLGIIVPCYNEQDVIAFCYKQLSALILELIASQSISEKSFILFIDDGSHDNTWKEVISLKSGSRIHGIKLATNVGHQNALIAGLDFCKERVDIAISTDADLQDDIEGIKDMIKLYQKGADIVVGVHTNRSCDSWQKRISAALFYRIMKQLNPQSISQHADFRLLNKKAINALAHFTEHDLYLRGITTSIGFKIATVEVARSPRLLGQSKYSFSKMLNLALNGITSTTTTPLRLILVFGLGLLITSLIAAVLCISIFFLTSHQLPSWVGFALPLYVLSGMQLLALGVVGEYLGRVHVESKRRPRYLIDTHFFSETHSR